VTKKILFYNMYNSDNSQY